MPDLPEGVEKVIYRAMAKRAEDRYASMGEFAAALEKLGLQAEPRKTSKPVPEMAGPGSKPIKENPPIRASNPGADETWDSGQAGVPTGAVKRGGVPVWAYLVGGVLVLGLIAGGVMLGLGIGSGKAVPTVNIQVINTLTPMVNRTEAPISSSPAADTPFTGTRSSPQSNPVGQYKVGSVQVSPKDGMTMVIVPEGDFIMGTADSDKSAPIGEKPQHTVFLDSYWIDQTDVTNAMYVKCVKDGACKESTFKDAPDFNGDNQPVIGIGWDSAKAYCQWAGRRLPTEAEWEKAARGTDGLIYPWGNQPPNGSLANFNKSGGKTADVGSFPAGASPYGALDMAGNVWQWVADWYDPSYYQSMTTWRNPTGPSSGYTRVVRGGSLFFGPDDVRSAVRVVNYASSGRSYFGFRCAESAGTTAASQAPVVTETASTLFARTGNSVSNLDGMKLMYIPAGAFQMGSEKGNSDEGPVHTVALDAFWIDQTDITNAMYAMCVSAKVCNEPWATGSYSRPIYYGNFLYADYPVVDVDWSQADAYCKWAGRSLPTEAQWEKAARGTDGRTYPWGEGVNLSKANYNGSDTTKAGSYPNGASPYGALDMAGNVLQWVADWYNSDYYAKSLEKDPPGPSSGNGRVMRGGSWHANEDNVRSSVRSVYKPSEWYSYLGFRCAMSAAP